MAVLRRTNPRPLLDEGVAWALKKMEMLFTKGSIYIIFTR